VTPTTSEGQLTFTREGANDVSTSSAPPNPPLQRTTASSLRSLSRSPLNVPIVKLSLLCFLPQPC
jgi:hypothetical protein